MSGMSMAVLGDRGWWERIGLRSVGLHETVHDELEVESVVAALLHMHPPVAFASADDGTALSVDELAALIDERVEQTKRDVAQRRREADDERRRHGWAMLEAALTGPAAHEPISDGAWAGFTRGEALAWCWNLYQYETRGFSQPGAHTRSKGMQQLEAGTPPEYFGYPRRARELADRGVTPREYRRHQEALGKRTFTQADVRWYPSSDRAGYSSRTTPSRRHPLTTDAAGHPVR